MDIVDYSSLEKEWLILGKAPAGFGKTSRIKKILEKKQAIWITLDEGCNEKYNFFQQWSRALILTIKRIEEETIDSLQVKDADFFYYANSSHINKKEKVITLLDRYMEMKIENRVLVLDNIHCIHNERCLLTIQTILSQYPNIQYFLLGREEPKFLVRYIISKSCFVLDEEKLYLSKEEIGELIQQHLCCAQEDVSKYAEVILYYFHGWPAGVYEIVKYLAKDYRKDWDSNLDEYILDSWLSKYVEYEIFEKIPQEEMYRLKMLAFIPECNEELYSYILNQNLFGEKPSQMEKKYFFIYREHGLIKCFPLFQLLLRYHTTQDELEGMVHFITQYYISKKQYEKANQYIFSVKSKNIMEQYLIQHYDIFITNNMIMSYVEGVVYLLKTGEVLRMTMLRCIAEIVSVICDVVEKQEIEKEIYLTLIVYNENPFQYATSLLEYFEKYLRCQRDKKKLCITSFGQFQVRVNVDDKELKWRTKKGCELFAYLYHVHGVSIKRQVLLEVLWPNGIPKNAVTMLHNMIYNIRKELIEYGLEDVILYKDKKYSLNMEWIESDYELRKTWIEKNQDISYLVEHEELVEQYPGQYLENIDNQWAIALKEYYDQKYMASCMTLADYYMKQKTYEKALIYLQNILQVDNLKEVAMGKALLCYGYLGERRLLQKEYSAFKNLIRMELGVEPCEYVKRMYEQALEIE